MEGIKRIERKHIAINIDILVYDILPNKIYRREKILKAVIEGTPKNRQREV
jgi:hypothetical protein